MLRKKLKLKAKKTLHVADEENESILARGARMIVITYDTTYYLI